MDLSKELLLNVFEHLTYLKDVKALGITSKSMKNLSDTTTADIIKQSIIALHLVSTKQQKQSIREEFDGDNEFIHIENSLNVTLSFVEQHNQNLKRLQMIYDTKIDLHDDQDFKRIHDLILTKSKKNLIYLMLKDVKFEEIAEIWTGTTFPSVTKLAFSGKVIIPNLNVSHHFPNAIDVSFEDATDIANILCLAECNKLRRLRLKIERPDEPSRDPMGSKEPQLFTEHQVPEILIKNRDTLEDLGINGFQTRGIFKVVAELSNLIKFAMGQVGPEVFRIKSREEFVPVEFHALRHLELILRFDYFMDPDDDLDFDELDNISCKQAFEIMPFKPPTKLETLKFPIHGAYLFKCAHDFVGKFGNIPKLILPGNVFNQNSTNLWEFAKDLNNVRELVVEMHGEKIFNAFEIAATNLRIEQQLRILTFKRVKKDIRAKLVGQFKALNDELKKQRKMIRYDPLPKYSIAIDISITIDFE